MRRREFIGVLCGAALVRPFAAAAQQSTIPSEPLIEPRQQISRFIVGLVREHRKRWR